MIGHHARQDAIEGNHIFGKEPCPHCHRAKNYLSEAAIDFKFHDVVKDPRALYEMIARVKPLIWLDGDYIGGADELGERLKRAIEANPERGQSSLSPHCSQHI